jgi:hypothetical protein
LKQQNASAGLRNVRTSFVQDGPKRKTAWDANHDYTEASAEVRADGCAPERHIDAQHIPYFVLPGRPFGDIDVGDVVVGHIKVGVLERLVFAIAADKTIRLKRNTF